MFCFQLSCVAALHFRRRFKSKRDQTEPRAARVAVSQLEVTMTPDPSRLESAQNTRVFANFWKARRRPQKISHKNEALHFFWKGETPYDEWVSKSNTLSTLKQTVARSNSSIWWLCDYQRCILHVWLYDIIFVNSMISWTMTECNMFLFRPGCRFCQGSAPGAVDNGSGASAVLALTHDK